MAVKGKKTTQKKSKTASNSVKKAKSASKGSSRVTSKAKAAPKKAATAKKAKESKKVTSKKVSKKAAPKKASPKTTKSKGGLLTKLVGKLTSKPAKDVSIKSSSKVVPKKADNKKPSGKEDKKALAKAKEQKVKAPVEKTAKVKKTSEETTSKVAQKNIAELTQEFTDKKASTSEVFLTDAEGRILCKYSGCDELAVVEGYCRYHYLLNWKRIQLKKKILSEGKLEKYINELTAKYPDKYIDMLRGDLKSEKDFISVVNELEIDDSDSNMSDDEEDSYIEQEVQGVAGGSKRSEDEY